MTFVLKVCLVGMSGSGKTTTLKSLCNDAFVSAENQRFPTKEESIAWEIPEDKKISTSLFVNFGSVKVNNGSDDYIIMIYDTLGYTSEKNGNGIIKIGDEFLRDNALYDSNGILFVLDTALDLYYEKYSKRILEVFDDLKKFYNKRGQDLPFFVVVCNKQDILHKRKIDSGSLGRKIFFEAILRSHDPFFNTVEFVNASAKDSWGIDEALNKLIIGMIRNKINKEKLRNDNKNIKNLKDNNEKSAIMLKLEDIFSKKVK